MCPVAALARDTNSKRYSRRLSTARSDGFFSSSSSSSIYWTGPFPGVKSPIEACAPGGGGGVCSLKLI